MKVKIDELKTLMRKILMSKYYSSDEADKMVEVEGVKIIGHTNYAAMVASDSSSFFARNLVSLLTLFVAQKDGKSEFDVNLQDDIIDGSLCVYQGELRKKRS